MKIVKFLRNHAPYNAGEAAGFGEVDAQRLVKAGVAEFVQPVEAPTPNRAAPDTAPAAAPKARTKAAKEAEVTKQEEAATPAEPSEEEGK